MEIRMWNCPIIQMSDNSEGQKRERRRVEM
jgi:hypothetical protein